MRDADRLRPRAFGQLRIARPSRDLKRAERFWVDGLGLAVLYRTGIDAEGGHALLMLGWPKAAWHLYLVENPIGQPTPNSTDETVLVLYLCGLIDEEAVDQLVRAGGQRVATRRPSWGRWGVTVVGPDGYRLVLSHRFGPDKPTPGQRSSTGPDHEVADRLRPVSAGRCHPGPSSSRFRTAGGIPVRDRAGDAALQRSQCFSAEARDRPCGFWWSLPT